MGIAARLEHADGGIDWTRVVGDVRDGKPVIVAAAGHYFVAEGHDPATGRFDFGNSAAVLRAAGGQRWFAPHELGSLGMGTPLSTIHLAASVPSLRLADLQARDEALR